MMELALQEGKGPVSRSTIAKCHDLSPKYIHTLLSSLVSAGFVTSYRGNVGGYVLNRKPEEINLLEILEALEGPMMIVDCVGSSVPIPVLV